ncbi:MAG TPA: HAD family acid phosphatase [Rhabdochlamydiaceae bacterium]|nr:HAD family acid phosphatase [Rhabdochlamydiaceae bacterium]
MRRQSHKLHFYLFFIIVLSFSEIHAEVIPNLSTVKSELIAYHDSGRWEKEMYNVVSQAKIYLQKQIVKGGKIAIVIDVDETALSKWKQIKAADFAFLPELNADWFYSKKAIANQPILDLYLFALKQNCFIFFIAGRPERFRDATIENLKKAGYTQWADLILRPNDDHDDSVVPFKSGARKRITEKGYRILANIGDQYSDLEGGYAEKTFKIPNPMYFIK